MIVTQKYHEKKDKGFKVICAAEWNTWENTYIGGSTLY